MSQKIAESERFSGLRREHFRIKAKIRIEHNILRLVAKKIAESERFSGLRREEYHSILIVCEDIPNKHNAKIAALCSFFIL